MAAALTQAVRLRTSRLEQARQTSGGMTPTRISTLKMRQPRQYPSADSKEAATTSKPKMV